MQPVLRRTGKTPAEYKKSNPKGEFPMIVGK